MEEETQDGIKSRWLWQHGLIFSVHHQLLIAWTETLFSYRTRSRALCVLPNIKKNRFSLLDDIDTHQPITMGSASYESNRGLLRCFSKINGINLKLVICCKGLHWDHGEKVGLKQWWSLYLMQQYELLYLLCFMFLRYHWRAVERFWRLICLNLSTFWHLWRFNYK